MAYKNQKKNQQHLKEIRKKSRSRKCAREKRRNDLPVFITDSNYGRPLESEYKRMMRK